MKIQNFLSKLVCFTYYITPGKEKKYTCINLLSQNTNRAIQFGHGIYAIIGLGNN